MNPSHLIVQILQHTPPSVWAILAGLLLLGLLQTRRRRVGTAQVAALPLTMLALGLWSMAGGFWQAPALALLWLAALATGSGLALRRPPTPGSRWLHLARRFELPGSWMPLLLILTIFSLRYALGLATAFNPGLRGWMPLQTALALVFGVLAGLSVGRAIALLRLTRQPQSAAMSDPALSVHHA